MTISLWPRRRRTYLRPRRFNLIFLGSASYCANEKGRREDPYSAGETWNKMAMRSALYYPHTTLDNVKVIKSALLLWDKVRLIVPYAGFVPHVNNPLAAQALEILADPHVPTDDERSMAHGFIADLANHWLPPAFYRGPDSGWPDYEMYSQKLLPHTWEMLSEYRLAHGTRRRSGIVVTQPTGLALMAILADCCASLMFCRITDEKRAYDVVSRLIAGQPERPFSRAKQNERLVSLALAPLSTKGIELRSLIDFRRREATGERDLRRLRHSYLAHVETYVDRLANTDASEADWREIARQFEDDVKDDLEDLSRELHVEASSFAVSNEVVTTVLVGAGSVLHALAGIHVPVPPDVAGPLAPVFAAKVYNAIAQFTMSRRKVMEAHPTAYLYQLGQR